MIDTEIADGIARFMTQYHIAPNLILLNVDASDDLRELTERYARKKGIPSMFQGIKVRTHGSGERVIICLVAE